MKTIDILEVLANMEEFEELGDIALPLHGKREALTMHEGGNGGGDQVKYLIKLA